MLSEFHPSLQIDIRTPDVCLNQELSHNSQTPSVGSYQILISAPSNHCKISSDATLRWPLSRPGPVIRLTAQRPLFRDGTSKFHMRGKHPLGTLDGHLCSFFLAILNFRWVSFHFSSIRFYRCWTTNFPTLTSTHPLNP
jgi:hypothetical protein